VCVFYCTSLGAAVRAPCALLSSHTFLCPRNCLYLFCDKIDDDDNDDGLHHGTHFVVEPCMYLHTHENDDEVKRTI